MQRTAQRAKALRLEQNITQQELADKVGIAVGTVKRFEKTGEIQFNHLLRIALVLGKLEDFSNIFAVNDVPASLYNLKVEKVRQRARKK
ncbi:MAG: helix-turn-helix transcriptional regulator [Lentisphaeria bacterium]|nr:helix-turn-helix transcriptional regulator [Lentisphaeria bacterium]